MNFCLDTSKILYYHSSAEEYNFFIYIPDIGEKIKSTYQRGI